MTILVLVNLSGSLCTFCKRFNTTRNQKKKSVEWDVFPMKNGGAINENGIMSVATCGFFRLAM